jgi:hypothetical protein
LSQHVIDAAMPMHEFIKPIILNDELLCLTSRILTRIFAVDQKTLENLEVNTFFNF